MALVRNTLFPCSLDRSDFSSNIIPFRSSFTVSTEKKVTTTKGICLHSLWKLHKAISTVDDRLDFGGEGSFFFLRAIFHNSWNNFLPKSVLKSACVCSLYVQGSQRSRDIMWYMNLALQYAKTEQIFLYTANDNNNYWLWSKQIYICFQVKGVTWEY